MTDFIHDCYHAHHRSLPVSGGLCSGAAFVPRQTLCLTCLADRLDALHPATAASALQDAVLLLQESFCPPPGARAPSATGAASALEPITADLARIAVGLCSAAAPHTHAPLYKAAKAFLSLVFTLLSCDAEDTDGGGDDREAALTLGVVASVPAGRAMALAMCDAVGAALPAAGESPGCLLLLTDLADMCPTFIGLLAAHGGAARFCAMLSALRDAYRVELVLYLLHQIFVACASRPAWLEALAMDLVTVSFLECLAWALEEFREEEPVVVNALCLARFVTSYSTTRDPLLAATPVLPRLLRGLTALLLHLNPDIVVAAAEALRAILLSSRPLDDCPDMADYVLESLRTAPAASAGAVVELLNALPAAAVPAGPALRVLFALPTVCVAAFASAARGPHLRHAARDRTTSASEFAQLAARSAGAHGVTLDALLPLLDCVAAAGPAAVLPETAAALASALLRLVDHACGADAALPVGALGDAGDWPFSDRLAALRGDAVAGLARGVALLWPVALSAAAPLNGVAAEVLAEALRRPGDWARAADADALLRIAAAALDALVAAESCCEGPHGSADDTARLLSRRVRCLLRCDLFAALLRVAGAAAEDTRALFVQRFVRLAPANRDGIEPPDPLVLDAAPSPRALLEHAALRRPRWAAALLLAIAAAQCAAPLDAHALDVCLHAHMDTLARLPSGDAAVAVLRAAAAYHMWRNELPAYEDMDGPVGAGVGAQCLAAAETRAQCAALLSSAPPRFIDALAARRWGAALLSLMLAAAALHRAARGRGGGGAGREEEEKKEKEEKDDDDDNEEQQEESERDAELCRLVVAHSAALVHLFAAVRQAPCGAAAQSVMRLLCRCVVVAGAGAAFARRLLEQHVSPLVLLLLHSAPAGPNSISVPTPSHGHDRSGSNGDGEVARLVALALSRIAPTAASGCDHALFTWALARVANTAAPAAVWQVLLLLLERTHGAEFALRHETTLAARLQAATHARAIGASASVSDALRWAVELSARRRGAMRRSLQRAAPLPLTPFPSRAVRAFVSAAAARDADVAAALDAAPELLAWAAALLAERCAPRAAARLAWRLLRARPALAASLEALALFWQLRHAPPPPRQAPGAEEGAWLLAALVAAWPPWAEAGGLCAAAAAFLAGIEPAPSPAPGRGGIGGGGGGERGARRAVRALVEACEEQSARCGVLPMSRARDFFLRQDTADADGGEERVAGFAAVAEDLELFLPSEEDMPTERDESEATRPPMEAGG